VNRTNLLRSILATLAGLFGLATIFAGTRVLLGADPGYAVFRPLLIYNTAMGLAYLAAGVMALRSSKQGMYASAVIFALNALVLAAIGYLSAGGHAVAIESVRAMIFRTVVWLVLLFGFMWVRRVEGRGAP
jgi:hypothetical protein